MMTMNSSIITLLLVIVMILSTHVHCFSRMQKSIKYPTITPSPGVTVITGRRILRMSTLVNTATTVSKSPFSGKIIVTGIGKVDEDEFMLNLLNEQTVWNTVVLATTASELPSVKKRFLSRTARYSGLLNILDFAGVDFSNDTALSSVLHSASAWLAFNVTEGDIQSYATSAIQAGVKRAVFTVQLPPSRINETVIPEFDQAIQLFEMNQGSFTGIRHGTIIPGDEDNSYEIANSTSPCAQATVERGVLSRVVAELLRVDSSSNKVCGLSSGNAFAAAYLDILRSSGLTRKQEVEKIFKGGIQRVAQLTVAEYEAQRKRREEREAERERERLEEALQLEKDKVAVVSLSDAEKGIQKAGEDPDDPAVDFDTELDYSANQEQLIVKRANEILMNVWIAYDTRMYSKSTPKVEFFENNMEKARALAVKELEEERVQAQSEELEKQATMMMVDQVAELERKQYAKLLNLEKKEISNQKVISDTWVRYIYLLLEVTMDKCAEENVLFHNLDEFQQTILLRKVANELRFKCKLPPYEVIYDPLDASEIVERLSVDPFGVDYGLALSIEEVVKLLNDKYEDTLKSVSALRGASQIIALAIDTLKKELPPPPPSVNEIRRAESAIKAEVVSAKKLESVRNRGKPYSEGESKVGRL